MSTDIHILHPQTVQTMDGYLGPAARNGANIVPTFNCQLNGITIFNIELTSLLAILHHIYGAVSQDTVHIKNERSYVF